MSHVANRLRHQLADGQTEAINLLTPKNDGYIMYDRAASASTCFLRLSGRGEASVVKMDIMKKKI